MRIFNRFRKQPNNEESGGFQLRPNNGQGPYTKYFNNFVPRKVEPAFYEFLREVIPIIDSAINRLVSLDGHIEVKGKNESLVDEIKEWIYNVRVNDMQRGLQAFHQNLTSEAFEQGFVLGEFVANKARTDIVQLRVGDSKFIKFKRNEHGLDILQRSDDDHEYRLLKPDNLVYFSIHNENQNPYGTPLMRSCEFVSQILVTIQNSIKNVWERFGDPSFWIVYKTSKKDGGDHKNRRDQMEKEFNTAIRAKREGKSADFIKAIDTNSEIKIGVIGADGQVLELEVPARHVLEQIVSKTGLPPWMLGLHWSTTERLSNAEAEMLLADVATRQSAKMPIFYNLVRTMLLLRGRSWKPEDWWLEWAGVNLHDIVKQAQARFLHAQADYYYMTTAQEAGITIDPDDLAIGKNKKIKECTAGIKSHEHCGCKELQRPFPWPELDQVEKDYEEELKSSWKNLLDRIKGILGFGVPKASKETDEFTFDEEKKGRIIATLKEWVSGFQPANEDSPVKWFYGLAYSLGLLRGAQMLNKDKPNLDIIKNSQIFNQLAENGFKLVKNNATKAILNKILPEMEAYVLTGSNPLEVAGRLEKLFGDQNSSWERLARTEMNMAGERAKRDEWISWDVKKLDFVPAPDACPICMALKGEYPIKDCPLPGRDTHPRCRCGTRPAESEV